MSGPFVLKIVVENSVLDLWTINMTIRSLSKEFASVGDHAMEEHASYLVGLKKVNAEFKFHYCTLCGKPHLDDGSWEGGLCECRRLLEEEPSSSTNQAESTSRMREIQRRQRLRVVGDPRLDPLFAGLSSKSKMLRTAHFTMTFSKEVMWCILGSAWLYRLSILPTLLQIGMAPMFKQYNESAVDILSLCIYLDLLRKEFCSPGVNGTNLVDIVLQVLAADPSEAEHSQELLNNDSACFETFLGNNEAGQLLSAISKSFWEIFSLHGLDDNAVFVDVLKNLGNCFGTFLTQVDCAHPASLFLTEEKLQAMLRGLPETFVWMPIYGGRPEDYVPPVNRFASHAATGPNGGGAPAGHPEE
jgi:hypothetical protein